VIKRNWFICFFIKAI